MRFLPALTLALALAFAGWLPFPTQAAGETGRGYFRFPALHGNTVVFTGEGDLWRVPATGGTAQRLTTHPGSETHAAISPDGVLLAFAAEYEGPTEVYTMPLAGGLPTRHTFDGGWSTVAGWTPEGRILVRSTVHSTLPEDQLSTLDPRSGDRRLLPLAQATEVSLQPGTQTLYFTRFPKQSSSTKRYQGGWIQNLWRFAPGDLEATPLTSDFKGTSRNPMWWDGRLYFLSDRDGIQNLWSILPDGSEARQHTRHREFDAAAAALHAGRIVYQHGADLRLHDVASGADSRIPIDLVSDFDQTRERWVKKPGDFLTAAHPSPNGDRVVLTARGQVFVAPASQGRLVEIPRARDVRYRSARFLPDGKSLVALSDASGELEFWRFPSDGLAAAPSQLTTNGTVFRFPPVPSPDGKWLAWSDKDLKLWIHHVDRGESRLVATSAAAFDSFEDLAWSPDSRWLAYTAPAANHHRCIHLYDVENSSSTALTRDRVDSFSPAWSPDGQWLYFLGERELRSLVRSPWGLRQPEPLYTESTRIFQFALLPGLRSPFQPRDELPPPSTNPTPPSASLGQTNTAPVVVPDLVHLEHRLHEVPVPPGNLESLQVTAKHLLWVQTDTGFSAKPRLQQLEISADAPKPKTLVDDVRHYELTADRKKILVRKGEAFHFIAADAPAPAKLEESRVPLDGWTFSIQPREEWRQIYTEAWRMLRDYFYDRRLHGVDWVALRAKYLPLVDRVADREELGDVLAALAGELSTLHIIVAGGDLRSPPDEIRTATLGAVLEREEAAGGWRIHRIYRADPDFPSEQGPLSRPGSLAHPGEILLRINGRSTLSASHPNQLLRQQAGKQVLLELQSPASSEPRRLVVHPISPGQESELRYDDWELSRRERVERLGQGAIGYVHLRAMGDADMAQWARHYYPVLDRPGLVIDVRNNRGGNIDSWILGRLLRKAWFYWQPRVGRPFWNMQGAFRGHVVVICNEKTASDGEAFTEGFRRLGLGKVIGTRTWGGEIWLSAQAWLVDRGMATAAELGVYGPEGTWLIEGHGVDPDLVVDNLPAATFRGEDAQLDAAIRHLQDLIARDPRPVPPPPPYPDKSFSPRP